MQPEESNLVENWLSYASFKKKYFWRILKFQLLEITKMSALSKPPKIQIPSNLAQNLGKSF